MIQFHNLRQGSQVFILHKGLTPFYEVGTIENIPTMQAMSYYPNMPMMPLDITVRIGEKVIPYQHIPPTAESAKVTSQLSGEEVCIACSKESINTELEILMQQSVDAINSVDAHRQRIETCKSLLNQLNPEKVKEAQQIQEIDSLKSQLSDMKEMMEQLIRERNRSSFPNKEEVV